MINSLLELIGALFLAALPILLTLARIRRRRRLRAEGAPQRRRVGTAWLSRIFGRTRRSQQGGSAPTESTGESRPARRRQEAEAGGSWNWQSESQYRSLPQTPPGDALLKRVERYPPLQRAIVLTEILGPPKGLE